MYNTYIALIKCVPLIIIMVTHSGKFFLNNYNFMIITNI